MITTTTTTTTITLPMLLSLLFLGQFTMPIPNSCYLNFLRLDCDVKCSIWSSRILTCRNITSLEDIATCAPTTTTHMWVYLVRKFCPFFVFLDPLDFLGMDNKQRLRFCKKGMVLLSRVFYEICFVIQKTMKIEWLSSLNSFKIT